MHAKPKYICYTSIILIEWYMIHIYFIYYICMYQQSKMLTFDWAWLGTLNWDAVGRWMFPCFSVEPVSLPELEDDLKHITFTDNSRTTALWFVRLLVILQPSNFTTLHLNVFLWMFHVAAHFAWLYRMGCFQSHRMENVCEWLRRRSITCSS